ncbi:MORC CW-type zinc finger protein 4 [Saguinus oedipus]|uniref:MORC CW-type zinc finger protein 4 n=1 Tax=Saguinus oedipus TaxID=9490 RepID=A0ABQ9TG01_SAGOE|nr:MORC CW-type zinc finger protein 4 [Saguinus oedipus]
MSPRYLQSNSSSHTRPFSAIAELLDNAVDPDVSARTVFIDVEEVKNKSCLTFTDDGCGMTPHKLHRMLRSSKLEDYLRKTSKGETRIVTSMLVKQGGKPLSKFKVYKQPQNHARYLLPVLRSVLLSRCILLKHFGFTDKVIKKSQCPIGVFGNGFKSGSMRLGKDALVFTKNGGTLTVGLLSQTYLECVQAQAVIVPIVPFNQQNNILSGNGE